MRASTVFVLALGLLVAFVAVSVAKSAGLFNPKAAAPAPEKPPATKILASRVNLFENITVTVDQVYVRDLRPEEEKALGDRFGTNWKDKLMQPMASAAHLRVVRQNLVADTILFKDQFEDAGLPESLSKQLEPGTRGVNVSVPKDKAAGGVLRVGEYVDLFLTTKVESGDRDELRTACIARGCKVVMKRNILWSMMAADPDDKPLHFTLQANPYRAALIEFAQTHGQLSLQPGSAPAKTNGSYSDPSSKEYANEDQRIDEMSKGVRTIGTEDLVRIFQITPPPLRPSAPIVPPIKIQHLSGVSEAGYTVFPGAPQAAPAAPAEPQSVKPAGGASQGSSAAPRGAQGETQQAGYNFRLPSATGEKECKSCDDKKKAAAEAAKYTTIRK